MKMNSILQDEKKCFICGRAMTYGPDRLELHHCFYGRPFRKYSDQYGLTVWLCGDSCHRNGKNAVHRNHAVDEEVKKIAQRKFEETHSREEFRQIFNKSVL